MVGLLELLLQFADAGVALLQGFGEFLGLEEIHLQLLLHQVQLLEGEFGFFPGRLKLLLGDSRQWIGFGLAQRLGVAWGDRGR